MIRTVFIGIREVMHQYIWVFWLMVAIAIIIYIVKGLDNRLVTVVHTLESDKIDQPITIGVITDLHSCLYGEQQGVLIDAIDAAKPDVIVLVGDIIDDVLPVGPAYVLLENISKRYPCFYVTGNHEYRHGDVKNIKEKVASYGIAVLEGDCTQLVIKGQSVDFSGIDDLKAGVWDWSKQLEKAESLINSDHYTVLLSHRPERVHAYIEHDFDLVIAGHAHGGQWRFPGLIKGLLVPNQGWLPKYVNGVYDLGNQSMVVSPGLAKESTRVPRFYNPPEFTVIKVQ